MFDWPTTFVIAAVIVACSRERKDERTRTGTGRMISSPTEPSAPITTTRVPTFREMPPCDSPLHANVLVTVVDEGKTYRCDPYQGVWIPVKEEL